MLVKCILLLAFVVHAFGMSYVDNARFLGMGNLLLVFRDDFQRLDLYDFANMPAAF